MPDDTDEVVVLTSIVRKLDALPPDARKRLLRYLTDRFDAPVMLTAYGSAEREAGA